MSTEPSAIDTGSGRRSQTGFLGAVAGLTVSGCLVYAPFVYGAVLPWAIFQLNAAILFALFCWMLNCVFRRRMPTVSVHVLILGLVVLAMGWFMVLNAHAAFNPVTFQLTTLHPRFKGMPGSPDRYVSRLAMDRLDCLFALLLITTDIGRDRDWRRTWSYLIAATSAAVAAFGIAQQAGVVTFVASRMNPMEGQYFSTYNYHGNAGAYMNLGLAISACLCAGVFAAKGRRTMRLAVTALLLVTVAGVIANTSRGAQVIGLGIVVASAATAAKRFYSKGSDRPRSRYVVPALAIAFVLLTVATGSVLFERTVAKWRALPGQIGSDSARLQVWRVTAPMAKSAGPFGYGPGAFKLMLPNSPMLTNALYSRWIIQRHIPGAQISMWSMAHNDYLQAVVEHGWVGTLILGTIIISGIVTATVSLKRRKAPHVLDNMMVLGAVVSILGILVHSLFDFPLQVESIQLTVAVLLGICYSTRKDDRTFGQSTAVGTIS